MRLIRSVLLFSAFLIIHCFYQPSVSSTGESLPSPEVPDAIEPFYQGEELWAHYRYDHTPDVDFNGNVARILINRNHDHLMEDYRLLALYMRASLIDLLSNGRLLNTIENFRHDLISGLQRWAAPAMMNTQVASQFAGRAGGDPWGGRAGAPTRKELLPSEMWGLSVYTGRIMGKPLSLATFLLSVVRTFGASAQNVVLLEEGSQIIGLFHTYPELYVIENTSIRQVDHATAYSLRNRFYGLANDRYYYSGIFDLDSTMLEVDYSLIEQIRQATGVRPFRLDSPYVFDYITREDLPLRFGTFSDPELGYALHSLMVPDRGLYLDVSAQGPMVEVISQQFDSTSHILQWMKDNLRLGSVYRNYQERIMTGDQVLVYRFGTRKDQALLLASYLIRKGVDASVAVTRKDAYVKTQSMVYRLSTFDSVEAIQDSVLLEMKR